MRIRNAFGTKFSGALGKDMVAVAWTGHEYIRAYAVPTGPPSDLQRGQRNAFKEALALWRSLSSRQKAFYRLIADGMTGCNLFLSRAVRAIKAGREPEVPMRIEFRTVDGQTVPSGRLIVRKDDVTLAEHRLDDGTAEVALTHSDAPYVVVLLKGTHGETVATVREPSENTVPVVLESTTLGIRLVRTTAGPPPEHRPGSDGCRVP